MTTQPPPGTVVNTPWGLHATCHLCGNTAPVDRWKRTLYPHTHATGDQPCPNRWGAADLTAAIMRDDQLTEEEKDVKGRTYRYLVSCGGPKVNPHCTHSACHSRIAEGLEWTLMGWRKAEEGQLAIPILD